MIRLAVSCWLLAVARAQLSPIENSVDLTSECALLLSLDSNVIPAAYPYAAPQTCITVDAVNQAYLDARKRLQIQVPADGKWTHPQIAKVGELLLDISTQLAKTYGMSVEDIEKGLPQMDTMKTLIREVCPTYLSDVTCHAGKYRRHDGLCNNMNNPSWGATNTPFTRLIAPQFADGMSEPRQSVLGTPLPLPRIVSRTIHPDEGFHDHAGTVMVVAWGQFMDHDFTLTATPLDRFTKNEPEDCCTRPPHMKNPYCMEITIPDDDYFYSKHQVKCQDFVRAFPSVQPNCKLGSRTPFNTLTGVIDGNTVYGVTEEFSRHLREGYGGLLRMNPAFSEFGLKDLLPLKLDYPDEGCTRANSSEFCFEAGEIRVNEQLVLACMHTLMAREHNRIAKELAVINPHWDDEVLYQEARRIIIAQIQHITFNEFLPIILGKEVMQKFGLMLEKEGYWDGYDPTVNPNIIDAFSAAAFRFGHSLLPTAVERWSKAHKFIASKRLSDLIRRPFDLYRAGVIDEYLMGLMNQVAQAMDDSITQEVTNHLLKKPGHRFGLDLVAFNMQRGREFGVPGFMFFRKFCGLPAGESFEDLFGSMPNTTVHRYMQIFQHPMDVDLWSGGVSEKPLPGSMIGPTFACIIATQMSFIRRGDRFWYELPNQPSSFTPEQLQEIRKTKLSRIICDNTDLIDTIQVYPMVLPDYEINPRVACRSGVLPSIDLTKWADYGNDLIDPRTKKMNSSKATQALHKDQPLYQNTTNTTANNPEIKNSTESEGNKTVVVTTKPLEVSLKKQNSFKLPQNYTNLRVLGMRSGSDINRLGGQDKVTGKGGRRRKRRGIANGSFEEDFGSIFYPSSKEIRRAKISAITSRSSEDPASLIDFASFEDFIKPIPTPFIDNKKKNSPKSFMTTTFFSSEDFINSPLTDSQFFSDENSALKDNGSGIFASDEQNVSKSKASDSAEDDYVDEKDAYDIHGFRGVNLQDRSSGPKPPAYTLAQKAHDFTPSRLASGKPAVFPQPKPPTVSTFKTNIIHKFPGYALPGTSAEVNQYPLPHPSARPLSLPYPHTHNHDHVKKSPIHDVKVSNFNTNNFNSDNLNTNNFNTNNLNTNNFNTNNLNTNNFNTNNVNTNNFNTNNPNSNKFNTNTFNSNNVNTNSLQLNDVSMNTINDVSMNNINHMNLNNLNMNDIQMNHEKLNNMINNMQINNANTNMNNNNNNDSGNNEDSEDDDDSGEEHHHHHYYDQLRHVHINPPKGFDPDSFRLTLPHYVKRGKYTGKKHKHFHHIENAPVIIKYEGQGQPQEQQQEQTPNETQSTKKPKSNKKKPTDRPLTESEEEAMYDEEGEISEKEIENAYKNYDDSAVTQDFVHDYDVQPEESSVEETKMKEVKETPTAVQTAKPMIDRHLEDVNRIFQNVSRALNIKSKNPKSVDFWKLGYLIK